MRDRVATAQPEPRCPDPKISEADHKELTQRYRTRALRLINQIDAGDDFKTLIEQELKTRLSALASAPAGEAHGEVRPERRP